MLQSEVAPRPIPANPATPPVVAQAEQTHGAIRGLSAGQLTVGKYTSLVWRETANEDVCLAVACACLLAESCQHRLAFGF